MIRAGKPPPSTAIVPEVAQDVQAAVQAALWAEVSSSRTEAVRLSGLAKPATIRLLDVQNRFELM